MKWVSENSSTRYAEESRPRKKVEWLWMSIPAPETVMKNNQIIHEPLNIVLIPTETMQWFKLSYTLIREKDSQCYAFNTKKLIKVYLIQLSHLTNKETKAKIYEATTC